LQFVRALFRAIAANKITWASFHPSWAKPTERIAKILVVACGIVVAYPYVPGSDTEAFKGLGIFAGLLLSLGSTALIGNILAGYGMEYRRTFFKEGDLVRIGEYLGYVAEIRLLSTYLRTLKNELVIIPNSMIINGDVQNYSTLAGKDGLILHSRIGIGYEAPWRQVEAMLLEAVARTPGLIRERPPYVLLKELGDFAVFYEINAYCDDARNMTRLYSALHQRILDVFNEYGVQIMTPAYEGDPQQPKVVPQQQWYAAPASASAHNSPAGTPADLPPSAAAKSQAGSKR
jgi:small-conductance mechanosensitive channel